MYNESVVIKPSPSGQGTPAETQQHIHLVLNDYNTPDVTNNLQRYKKPDKYSNNKYLLFLVLFSLY